LGKERSLCEKIVGPSTNLNAEISAMNIVFPLPIEASECDYNWWSIEPLWRPCRRLHGFWDDDVREAQYHVVAAT
jgi:hypothetical protein